MKNRAFTLVELVVSMSILSIVMVSVFEVYSNIVTLNKRLELDRILQENSRLITETVAKDVRSNGIDFAYYDGSESARTLDYSASGTSVLQVASGPKYFLMQEGISSVIGECLNPLDQVHPCFFGKEEAGERVRLTDPRVAITNLRFYISGDSSKTFLTGNTSHPTEGKVTMAFSLKIATSKGVDEGLAKSSEIRIQTTVSEKLYKAN